MATPIRRKRTVAGIAARAGVSSRVIEGFRKIDCECIADVLNGLGLRCVVHGILPLDRGMKICGPAVTLRQIASRDSQDQTRHEQVLLEICAPGDVLVMDVGGRTDGAPWGGNITLEARTRGLEGVVVDGAARDSGEIIELGFPTFCRGVTLPHTHGLFHTTCVNSEPIQIGGPPFPVMVAPGDLVVGDAGGLVIVPIEIAGKVLKLARDRHEKDERKKAWLGTGNVRTDAAGDPPAGKRATSKSSPRANGHKKA